MAWNIVQHAFRMVFGNMGQALKVSLVPFGLLAAFSVLVIMVTGEPLDGSFNPENGISGLAALLILSLVVFLVFVMGWVAVSWHRFILLEEYTALVPATKDRPIWSYVWRSFILGLLIMLIAMPILMIAGFLLAPTVGSGVAGFSIFSVIIGLLLGALLSYLWFRWAIILPSIAVGEPMTLRQAWAETAATSGVIFKVAIIVSVLKIAASTIVSLFYVGLPIVALVADVAVNWTTLMVGVSILTTLYGHVVEGRPLSGA